MTIGSEELFYELPSGQEKLLNFYIDGKDKL
jgi:hypothetical protein